MKSIKKVVVLVCLTAALAAADTAPTPTPPSPGMGELAAAGLANVAGILIGWATTVVVTVYRSL